MRQKRGENKQEDSIMYITKYDKNTKLVESTIKKQWKILQQDTKHAHLFKKKCRHFCIKKGKTIGDQLVSSDLEKKKKIKKLFYKLKNVVHTLACPVIIVRRL